MNGTQEPSWAQDPMNQDSLDFGNLLDLGTDLGDIDITQFPIEANTDNNHMQYATQHQNQQFSGNMQGMQNGHAVHDFAQQDFDMAGLGLTHGNTMQNGTSNGSDMQDFALMNQQMWNGQHGQMPQHQQQQQQQQQQQHPQDQMQGMVYRQQHPIPPTPNSYELHGSDHARYAQHQLDAQARSYLEQQFQRQQKQDSFTPLVSPAVTPQDSQYQHQLPEFAVPGTYFSPLTSPALLAQNALRQRRAGQHTQPSTAGTSAAASPTSSVFDIDMTGNDSLPVKQAVRRRKQHDSPIARGSATSLRQSPAVKPRKRKSESLSTALADSVITQQLQSRENSATDSVSPEALSEALMGPPPRPGSAVQSPVINPQANSAPPSTLVNGNANSKRAAPATPASLMYIDNSQRANIAQRLTQSVQPAAMSRMEPGLDDFALPPSATSNRQSRSGVASADTTPRINARKTPKLGPLSTASSTINRSGSATSSPSISAITSPQSAGTPFFGKDGKARRGSKWGSVSAGSNVLVSPALRPKISPSIKPLLPEGASLTDSQQALLLASKSNYTHLLEGTLIPGVSYPDSLSSGLTSKRTSHKIAEQGRRNRINEALKEMQALLPSPAIKPKSDIDEPPTPAVNGNSKADDAKNKNAAEAKAANSKAATVESAIEYIRTLQQEREAMELAIRAKDDEMTQLRKRLEAALGSNGSGTSSSDAGSSEGETRDVVAGSEVSS